MHFAIILHTFAIIAFITFNQPLNPNNSDMLRRLLLWIIPLALSVPGAGAEVHLQKFNGPTPSNSHPEEFAPEGWGRIVDSFEKWGDGP